MEIVEKYNFEGLDVFAHMKNTSDEKKPVIVLIHGFATDHRCFRYFEEILNKEKYNFFNFDLPGSGSLDKYKRSQLTVKGMGKILTKFLKRTKINNFIIIGHSMGGSLAGIVASYLESKVLKLILLSPLNRTSFPKVFSKADKFQINSYKSFMKLQKEVFVNPEDTLDKIDLEEYYEQSMIMYKTKLKFFMVTMLNIASPATTVYIDERYRKIKNKTIIYIGEQDRFISLERSIKYFFSIIKDIKIEIISCTGHGFFIEKKDEFNTMLINDLKGTSSND